MASRVKVIAGSMFSGKTEELKRLCVSWGKCFYEDVPRPCE
jgi:thymidine kinase